MARAQFRANRALDRACVAAAPGGRPSCRSFRHEPANQAAGSDGGGISWKIWAFGKKSVGKRRLFFREARMFRDYVSGLPRLRGFGFARWRRPALLIAHASDPA